MSRPQSTLSSRNSSSDRAVRERSTSSARPSPISATFPQMPNIDALTMQDSLSSVSIKPASRPGRGTSGKPGKALVNFFHLDIKNMPDIVSYASEHKEKGRNVSLRITQRSDNLLLQQQEPRFRFAASNYGNRFYSRRGNDLIKPGEPIHTHKVDYYDSEEPGPRPGDRQFNVSVILKKDGEFLVAPFQTYVNNPNNLSFPRLQEFISMINTLLDRGVSQNGNLATFARRTKFFDLTSTHCNLGGGLDAYLGFFKSVRDCEAGLFLNVNTSACAMFKTGRSDAVMSQLSAIPEENRGVAMKGCRVQTTYSGSMRTRTVMGLASTSERGARPTANNVSIQCPQHGKETVGQHFRRAWPGQPQPNPNALVFDFGNQVYIPSDLATIQTPQPFRGALSPDQTAEMIKFACRRPAVNKDLIINTGVPCLGFNTPGGPQDRFGINLFQKEMFRVDVRLLPSPGLRFGGTNTEGDLSGGSWNLRGRKFELAASAEMVQLSFIHVKRPGEIACQNVRDFLRGIEDGIRSYFGLASTVQVFSDFQHEMTVDKHEDPMELARRLNQEYAKLKTKGIKLIFMLLPDAHVGTYQAIKIAGDVRTGIHTVCSVRKTKTALKTDPGTIANLLLKVNTKLGGRNWVLQPPVPSPYKKLLKPGTMIVGADVVHPGPTAMTDAPSIAAIVSTYDQYFYQYCGTTRTQVNRNEQKKATEVIVDLRGMMLQQLKFFQSKNNNKLPNVIIYMRDGVSEGQFTEAVLDEELPGIKQACGHLYENTPMPKIVVIATLKRHHTRFFKDPDDKSSSSFFDKNGNPMPGFTVDRDIVAKYAADFYNVSHACIQGTSRPCKYVLLYDSLGVTADEIQLMVYHMCFTFARASKSIGIHPAVRFADLLCDRARLYFRSVYNPPMIAGREKPRYTPGPGHWSGRVTSEIAHSMFFI